MSSQATQVALGWDGIDAVAVSLYWSQSNDTCFVNYTVEASGKGPTGPWSAVWDTAAVAATSVVIWYAPNVVLSPGKTSWWRVVDRDCNGSNASNVLAVTPPPFPTLTYDLLTPTSVRLLWDNPAVYGGRISFVNYTIQGTPPMPPIVLTDRNQTEYTVTGLQQSDNYLFDVQVIDHGMISPDPYYPGAIFSYLSNWVNFTAPWPLVASPHAAPSDVDVGHPVSFTCSPQGGVPPYTFGWTFGDGSMGQGNNVSHEYGIPGRYTATCSVTDSSHVRGTNSTTVTVHDLPQASLAASRTSVDTGQVLVLTASAGGGTGGYTYRWTNLPPGCINSNSARLDCTPSGGGFFTIGVTVTDSSGVSASAFSPFVIVTQAPFAVLGATPGEVLLGQNVAFRASPFGGSGGNQYTWTGLPSGCTAPPAALIIQCAPAVAGRYNVSFTVTDSNGGRANASVFFVVDSGLLGMPTTQAIGLLTAASAAILGGIVGVMLWARRRKGPRAPPV